MAYVKGTVTVNFDFNVDVEIDEEDEIETVGEAEEYAKERATEWVGDSPHSYMEVYNADGSMLEEIEDDDDDGECYCDECEAFRERQDCANAGHGEKRIDPRRGCWVCELCDAEVA